MDANPVIWRATGQYLARPLNGIWATGPYLHNGSVPTLYDSAPSRSAPGEVHYRAAAIRSGEDRLPERRHGQLARTYGSSIRANPEIATSDTAASLRTTLPEDQKAALLEYLKKL